MAIPNDEYPYVCKDFDRVSFACLYHQVNYKFFKTINAKMLLPHKSFKAFIKVIFKIA